MTKPIDPIVLELINSKVTGIVDEMRAVLFHSGYSTVLRESEDGSAGLLDAQLRTVSTSKKLPLHFGSFSAIRDHLHKYYAPEELEEGDVLLFNDPYEGNATHPPDTITLMPVFLDGRIVGYTASLAHKPDLGGPRSKGAARDLWEEGLVIRPIKFYVRGQVNREVERLIASNSRLPVETLGDLRGQVAACRVGADRLKELCVRFGADVVAAASQELMTRLAARLRDELRALPDGSFEAVGILDHDSIDFDRPLHCRLLVTKRGDDILFDFSGSDLQAKGPINCVSPLIKNCCYFGLMAMTDPNLPFNHGFVEVARTQFKEGTIVCPRPGSAVNNYVPLAYLASDVVLAALGGLWPEKAVGSAGGGGGITLRGIGSGGRKPWLLLELLDTALGATSTGDGISLIHGTLGMGQFRPGPIEIHETEFPLRVTRFDVLTDSGGPGRFRGGLGSVREYEVLEEVSVPVDAAKGGRRSLAPPWGVAGGKAARPGDVEVNGVPVSERAIEVELQPGDRLTVSMNAGGGYGDPYERDPKKVLGDVLDGYVSIEMARADYGVAIDPATRTIDHAATAGLRARR